MLLLLLPYYVLFIMCCVITVLLYYVQKCNEVVLSCLVGSIVMVARGKVKLDSTFPIIQTTCRRSPQTSGTDLSICLRRGADLSAIVSQTDCRSLPIIWKPGFTRQDICRQHYLIGEFLPSTHLETFCLHTHRTFIEPLVTGVSP